MLNLFENILAAKNRGKYEPLIMIVIFVIIAIFNVIKSVTKAAKEKREKEDAALRPAQMRYKPITDQRPQQQQAMQNKQVHQHQAHLTQRQPRQQASPDIRNIFQQQELELQKRKAQELKEQRRKENLRRQLQQQKQQQVRPKSVVKPAKRKDFLKPRVVVAEVEEPVLHVAKSGNIVEMPLEQLRQAIILKEILDKPIALR